MERLVHPACLGLLDRGWSCRQLSKVRRNWWRSPCGVLPAAAAATDCPARPACPAPGWELSTHGPVKHSHCRSQRGGGSPESAGQRRGVRWTLGPNPRRRHDLGPRVCGWRELRDGWRQDPEQGCPSEECFVMAGREDSPKRHWAGSGDPVSCDQGVLLHPVGW